MSEWRQWLTRPGCNTQDASTDSNSCLQRPSKNAYRWIRGLTGWSRSPVGLAKCNEEVPAGDIPFDDETFSRDTLEQSTKNGDFWAQNTYYSTDCPLASLWKVNTCYSCDFPTHELSRLDVLYAHRIRIAALTFPIATGVGCDNIAPRAIARLSDDVRCTWQIVGGMRNCWLVRCNRRAGPDCFASQARQGQRTHRSAPNRHSGLDARPL